jgi:hypothetical protein
VAREVAEMVEAEWGAATVAVMVVAMAAVVTVEEAKESGPTGVKMAAMGTL